MAKLSENERQRLFQLGYDIAMKAACGDDTPGSGDDDVFDFPKESAGQYYPYFITVGECATCPRYAAYEAGFFAFVKQGLEGSNDSDNIQRDWL